MPGRATDTFTFTKSDNGEHGANGKMTVKDVKNEPNLLGVMQTEVVGLQYHAGKLASGMEVRLVRENNNKHDANAIRVDNDAGESAGYIPAEAAAWLSPLLDGNKLRVSGRIRSDGWIQYSAPMELFLWMLPGGQSVFLRDDRPTTGRAALHQMVLGSYIARENWDHSEAWMDFTQRMKPLVGKEFFPETRLLLELMQSRVRDRIEQQTEYFSRRKLNKWRQKAQRILDGPKRFKRKNGWSRHCLDPLPVEKCLKHLRLKQGIVLRAYLFTFGGNGRGFVFALPVDAPFPHPEYEADFFRDAMLLVNTPSPPDSLPSPMHAFEGDGSPASYMEAAILGRELTELGALWHGVSWGVRDLMDVDPVNFYGKSVFGPGEWEWESQNPIDWRPHVEMTRTACVVRFYTYGELGCRSIYRHIDTFVEGSYAPIDVQEERIANAPGGFMF